MPAPVSIPVLWDRHAGTLVSDDPAGIDSQAAFQATTDFAAFTAPFTHVPPWSSYSYRSSPARTRCTPSSSDSELTRRATGTRPDTRSARSID